MASTKKLPSYRRHKNGQAFAQIKGRRVYLGKYDTPESRAAYGQFIAELAVSPLPSPPSARNPRTTLTVVELANAYRKFAEGYYRKNGEPTSQVDVIKQALKPLIAIYGTTPISDFDVLSLRAIQETFVGRGLAIKTVNVYVAEIRRAFKWGVSNALCPVTIWQALTTVPSERKGRSKARQPKPIKPVADGMIETILPHLTPLVGDMIRFERITGCRPGEVRTLQPREIDQSTDPWIYRPTSFKTEHHDDCERVIFIGPKAQEILRPYLSGDADDYCFSPAVSEQQRREARHAARKTAATQGNHPGTNRKACPQRKAGGCYTKDSYARAIKRACMAAGMPKTLTREEEADWCKKNAFRPNQLRHAAGTQVRKEFGLEAAQVTLGHRGAAVTEIYAERDYALAADVARKIG